MFDHHLVNVWSCQCLIITFSMHLLPPAPGLLEATASKSTLASSPTWRSCLLAFLMCFLVFVKPFLFLQGCDVKTESVGDRLLMNLIICNPSFWFPPHIEVLCHWREQRRAGQLWWKGDWPSLLFHLTLVAKSKSEVAFKESADSDLDLALRGESGDPNARPGR